MQKLSLIERDAIRLIKHRVQETKEKQENSTIVIEIRTRGKGKSPYYSISWYYHEF